MIPTLLWPTPTLSLRVLCGCSVSESITTGSGSSFSVDVGICVGFFTETTGSIRNPKTRRNPSYIYSYIYVRYCPKQYLFVGDFFLYLKKIKLHRKGPAFLYSHNAIERKSFTMHIMPSKGVPGDRQ